MTVRCRCSGNPQRVADAVGLNPVTNQGLFSVSDTGTLAYFAGTVGETELVWFDRDGTELGRPGARGVISTIALSPDASRVVFDQADPRTATFDLWQLVFAVGAPDKLTFNPSHDIFPMWSPDGSRIVFTSVRERPPQLYEMDPDVAGGERRLFQSPMPVVPSGWSRDGNTLFYTGTDAATATGDVWSVSLDDKASVPLVQTTYDERYGVPSPDGRWLAYVSNESGTYEVNVRALHGPGVRRQVSTKGGSQPQWRPDTGELIYMAPDRTLVAVDFQSGRDAFEFGSPQPLFRTRTKSLEIQGTTRTYAMTSRRPALPGGECDRGSEVRVDWNSLELAVDRGKVRTCCAPDRRGRVRAPKRGLGTAARHRKPPCRYPDDHVVSNTTMSASGDRNNGSAAAARFGRCTIEFRPE